MTVNSSPRLPPTTSMTGHHYRRCTFCWTQRDTGWPLIFAHLELVSTLSFKTSSLRGETEIFTNIHFYCNSTDVSCLVCNNSIDPSSQSPLIRHPTIAAKDNFTSRCLLLLLLLLDSCLEWNRNQMFTMQEEIHAHTETGFASYTKTEGEPARQQYKGGWMVAGWVGEWLWWVEECTENRYFTLNNIQRTAP